MDIVLKEIPIRDLVAGYENNEESGVFAYGGKLDVRPPYQREFIYSPKQREAVIDTITQGFPLNVMYWSDKGGGHYEIIDGQQRTVSICQYLDGEFSFDMKYFQNQTDDIKSLILDYKLMIYICAGTDTERLKWFETINIAGEQLTAQELRNAVYSGSWVIDAKRYFSKSGCPAYRLASDYMKGSPIRQDYLETAIDWFSKGHINDFMGVHQNDPNASELWRYFQSVISWVESTFITKRPKYMKGIPWGPLYNEFHKQTLDQNKIDAEISALILDDEVQNKKGIYSYVLSRNEKFLNIRSFSDAMRLKVYELQKGICKSCGKKFDLSDMEADHVIPWHKGGKTSEENCHMLCMPCNRTKSGK